MSGRTPVPESNSLPLVHAVEFVAGPRKRRHIVASHDARLADVDFTQVGAVRNVRSYSGQRHKPVFAYVHSSPHLILCESRLEARVLLELDFEGLVARVAAQPLRLHYTIDGRHYLHTPDFAVADAHSRISIIDVKPTEHQDWPKNQRDFRATADWCERMGFRYRVLAGYAEPAASTIRFLAGYRQHPQGWRQEAPIVLKQAAESGGTVQLAQLADRASDVLALPVPVVLPTIYSLMWHGFLGWDIHQPLEMDLVVRQTREWHEVSP